MPSSGQTSGGGAQQEKTFAFDMLKDSKFCITGLTRAATEAVNPRLREFINIALGEAIDEHFRLADTMIAKGWYHPTDLQQQLQADLQMARQAGQNTANPS